MSKSKINIEIARGMKCAALTVQETADLLGVDRRTAAHAMDRGEIPCIKIGARRLVPRLPLLALLDGATA